MTDYIQVDTGAMPWQPTAETELVEVLHEFTIPLVGTVKQAGHEYLFWCVVGHSAPENAWAYSVVSEDALQTLREAEGADFDAALMAAVDGTTTVFAIATDDGGCSVSIELEPPAGFMDVYPRGMIALHHKIANAQEQMRVLSELFPRLTPPTRALSHRISGAGCRPGVLGNESLRPALLF